MKPGMLGMKLISTLIPFSLMLICIMFRRTQLFEFYQSSCSVVAGFWTKVYLILIWLWTWDSSQRLESTPFSSPSSSSMRLICLRKLDTGDTLPSTDISRKIPSTNIIPFSSTLRTGAKMRTGMVISSLLWWRRNPSSWMIGRPSCGLVSSAFR